jgi:hypothetical protein
MVDVFHKIQNVIQIYILYLMVIQNNVNAKMDIN